MRSARAATSSALFSSGSTRQLYTSVFCMNYSVVHVPSCRNVRQGAELSLGERGIEPARQAIGIRRSCARDCAAGCRHIGRTPRNDRAATWVTQRQTGLAGQSYGAGARGCATGDTLDLLDGFGRSAGWDSDRRSRVSPRAATPFVAPGGRIAPGVALTPGTRIGPYEIAERIGVGGMGEVYRAADTRLGRDVAVKVLPDSFARDAERLARFDREARTLASLNHPNIAAIYGLEDSDGSKALVMELVEGPTLADRIAGGAIPVDEALPIARQIAEALEAAHERGIVHRDLKPANVKARPDGTVKVLDFGLAKAMEPTAAISPSQSMSPTITTPAHLRPGYGGQAMTEAGVILGTAAYMSPEQARGRPADRRSDVWALGCVLAVGAHVPLGERDGVAKERAFEQHLRQPRVERGLQRDGYDHQPVEGRRNAVATRCCSFVEQLAPIGRPHATPTAARGYLPPSFIRSTSVRTAGFPPQARSTKARRSATGRSNAASKISRVRRNSSGVTEPRAWSRCS